MHTCEVLYVYHLYRDKNMRLAKFLLATKPHENRATLIKYSGENCVSHGIVSQAFLQLSNLRRILHPLKIKGRFSHDLF